MSHRFEIILLEEALAFIESQPLKVRIKILVITTHGFMKKPRTTDLKEIEKAIKFGPNILTKKRNEEVYFNGSRRFIDWQSRYSRTESI